MQVRFVRYLVYTGIIAAMLMLENCGSTVDPKDPNKAPTCSISTPSNSAVFALGTIVPIAVTARDTDGTIAKVIISIDNAVVATLSVSPYTFDWNTAGATPGQQNIKAEATDNGGLSTAAQITVTLSAEAPVVTTTDISEITGTTATSGGNVTDDGGIDVSARGVVWGESSDPTIAINDGFTTDGSGTGAFTSSLTSLSAATTYYVKAYATNSQGTGYGAEKSFITAGLPNVKTGDIVTDITSQSAVCTGEVTDDGGELVTARGLVWGIMSEPTLDNMDGFTIEGSGIGTFASTMTSLVRVTGYYMRAYATNSAGTVYGSVRYFLTLPDPPTLTTAVVTEIGAHVAVGGGEITDLGGASSAPIVGLIWSTTPGPDFDNNYEAHYPLSGTIFNGTITGLDALTTYYVKSYATYNGGYVYGEEKSFTTIAFTIQTGSFTDARDNTQYKTVSFGGQIWMAENLAYLSEVCPSDTECGSWVYDYEGSDVSVAKATSNYTNYGVLYDWESAGAVCPTGWHLPSHDEWRFLVINLGMEYYTSDGTDMRGTDEGGKLKEMGVVHWNDPNVGATNISGFTALPGGMRSTAGNTFEGIKRIGNFWTSSLYGNFIYSRYLYNDSEQIGSQSLSTQYITLGFSVRCIKD